MVRTQIQLPEDQAAAIKKAAARLGVSVAEIIRRSIDCYLASGATGRAEAARRRALAAIGCARGGPPDLATNHDRYFVESLSE